MKKATDIKIADYWLALGVAALALSGLFTIPLMVGRTSNMLPAGFFDPSLIVHVNLDVLVWLLAITVSHFNTQRKPHKPVAFFVAALAIALIVISPFTHNGEAYQNNYIPIFDNAMFKTGIALFLGVVTYEAITTLFSQAKFKTKTVATLILLAMAAILGSYHGINDKTSSQEFFNTLFWGGGHILQFAYVQIMLIAWLILAEHAEIRIPINQRLRYFIFTLPVIFVLLSALYIYATVPVESQGYIQLFTQMMIFGTGIAAIPLGLLLLLGLVISARWNLYSAILAISLVLFAIGGVLGNQAAQTLAQGETTIIPAHYHFSNVAVTVALMGYIFTRLKIKRSKLCFWQIVIYAFGQLSYFTGMAIFGSHGAARKTPGLGGINMDEHSKQMLAHMMEGLGGLGLIGGILFIVIVLKHFRKTHDFADNNQ